jgi:amidohydrolase
VIQVRATAALKAALYRAMDGRRDEIVAFAEDVLRHPELGFAETRTAATFASALRALGFEPREGVAVTGVVARVRGGAPGPTVAVMGELDALPVPGHPFADPMTGAAHACGHHAQLTHVLAVAHGLAGSGLMKELSGDVLLIGVPAEEHVGVERWQELVRAGRIEFKSGKQELVRLGELENVDAVLLTHASARPETPKLSVVAGTNGYIVKRARFVGKGAHASRPYLGVNALHAASLALDAINAVRDTFRDEDHIRVHPILTKGGTAVNVVPSEAVIETFIRGRSIEAIADAEQKVMRALRAGALGLGAAVEIQTQPGFLPLLPPEPALERIYRGSAEELVGADGWAVEPALPASTDVGDLSHLMPVLHPFHGGCSGQTHADDFLVRDPELAYLTAAKAMAGTVVDLLADGAREARAVKEGFHPVLTTDAYLAHVRSLDRVERFDGAA